MYKSHLKSGVVRNTDTDEYCCWMSFLVGLGYSWDEGILQRKQHTNIQSAPLTFRASLAYVCIS